MNAKNRIGWWLAQAFVAALLVGIGVRVAGLPKSKDVAAPKAASLDRGGRGRASGDPPKLAGVPPLPGGSGAEVKSPPIDPSPAASKPALRGSPYLPEHYREARTVRSADPAYETWDLDPGELAWLMANQKTVLTEDLGTVSRAEGGLRVTRVREDSFAARRGLQVGDVLLDINGQELNDHYDLEELWENRGYTDSKGWRLSVLRSGEPFTIDYRKVAHVREH